MKKLSLPQLRMLRAALGPDGDRTPFLGNRHAGRAASAWYRTAASLVQLGLVTTERSGALGDYKRARTTDAGRAVLRKLEDAEIKASNEAHRASAENVSRVFRETRQYDAAIHEVQERADIKASLAAYRAAGADGVPPCAAAMGCLCAGHARGDDASAQCNTDEVAR